MAVQASSRIVRLLGLGLALTAVAAWAGPLPPLTTTTGTDVTLDFNGFTGTPSSQSVIQGLTSKIRFWNFQFSSAKPGPTFSDGTNTFTYAGGNLTKLTFQMEITNNSSIVSRLSGVGFDYYQDPSTKLPDLVESVDASRTYLKTNGRRATTVTETKTFNPNTASGDFNNVDVTVNSFSNGIKNVDFCFSNQSCPGGAGSGIWNNTNGSVTATLWFTPDNIKALTFNNFYVRYQSLTVAEGSAAGMPVCVPGVDPDCTSDFVPEPSFYGLLGLGMAGLIFARHAAGRRTQE